MKNFKKSQSATQKFRIHASIKKELQNDPVFTETYKRRQNLYESVFSYFSRNSVFLKNSYFIILKTLFFNPWGTTIVEPPLNTHYGKLQYFH